MIVAAVGNLLVSSTLAFIWCLINVLQIITHLPLLNVGYMPQLSTDIHSSMAALINFDAFPSSSITSLVLDLEESAEYKGRRLTTEDDDKIPQRYIDMGYESHSIIKNLGFLFILGFFAFLLFVITLITVCLIDRCQQRPCLRLERRAKTLRDIFIWGIVLRLLLESYLELTVGGLINI